MKTVKEKLDEGYYLRCLRNQDSEELVRRKIIVDLIHELDKGMNNTSAIYAMFIWGEVVKQNQRYNKA